MKKIIIGIVILIAISVIAIVVLNINNPSLTLPNAQTNEYPEDYFADAPSESTIYVDAPQMEVNHDHPEIAR